MEQQKEHFLVIWKSLEILHFMVWGFNSSELTIAPGGGVMVACWVGGLVYILVQMSERSQGSTPQNSCW